MVASLEDALAKSVSVRVDYYNDEHKGKLLQYPDAPAISAMAGSEVQIPVEEILKYFVFHEVRHKPGRARDPASKRRDVAFAYEMLRRYVTFDSSGIRLTDGIASLPNHIVEYLGESIGLAVTSRLHGINESDWLPIEVKSGKGTKVLDYETASDGNRVIQLETKGSLVNEVDKKSSSASQQRADVEKKKAAQPKQDPKIVRYGTIAAIPKENEQVRCWLLDPEPEGGGRDPRSLRLFARLHFIRWFVWLIAPRSILAIALGSRISALEALENPFELSDVPLTDSSGNEITIEYPVSGYSNIPAFFGSRSHVKNGPAGGIVLRIDQNTLLFVAFREELLFLATKQDFGKLLEYSAPAAVTWKDVRCVLRNTQLRRMGLDAESLPNAVRSETETHFDLAGRLVYSAEGLVFGELPISREELRRTQE